MTTGGGHDRFGRCAVTGRELAGQTVVVIGGSCGIGLETARQARSRGAGVILTARNPDAVYRAGLELRASIAAFDATDFDRLGRFFDELRRPIDHLVLAGRDGYDAPLATLDLDEARRDAERQLWLPLRIAQLAMNAVRAGGSLLLIGGSGGRRSSAGPLPAAMTASLSALTTSLSVELAPVRANLVAPSYPVGPSDVAAVAVHLMAHAAITGATFGADGERV
jgi:NAD(P)-dependent dehydrogenase (short-subunit alcohol dehydrogenase family)